MLPFRPIHPLGRMVPRMKRWLLILVSVLALSGCGYNEFQKLDEQAKSAWSEVLNQYQRRADLVPNLVATVKGELSSALSRLLVVSERYPDLKANKAFSDLRVQLDGTENRITVARNRYIQAVQQYNVLARSFPTNLTAMVFHYEPKQ